MPPLLRSLPVTALLALVSACAVPPRPPAGGTFAAAPPPAPAEVAVPVQPAGGSLNGTLASLANRDLSTLAADLSVANRIARAAQPPDTEGIACFTALSAEVAELTRLKRVTVQPAGTVSAFEASRVMARGIDRMSSPAHSSRLEWKCGPLYMGVENGLAGLLDALKVPR